MKKRIVIVAIIGLFLLILPLIAGAEIVDSGTCGENATWTLDDQGVLTIGGTGDMYDYDSLSNHSPWYDIRSKIKNILIDENITHIGKNAFYFCSKNTNISIPNSVVSIGESAFIGNNLQKIEVSDNNSSFASIDGVLYDKSLTTLIKCPESKTSINIPDSIISIKNNAFYSCSYLEDIHLPDGVVSIGNNAFSFCSRLKNIVLPETLEELGISVFSNCSKISQIVIPSCLNTIPYNMFNCCSSLTSISIPTTVALIDSFAFSYCKSLTSVSIPSSVTQINNYAFSGCSNLISILVPNSVETINGNKVFDNCSSELVISCHPNSAALAYASEYNYQYSTEGHKEIIITETEPTCTENGILAGSFCPICGISPDMIIPALGHNEITEFTVVPSCTHSGLKNIVCDRCGEVLVNSVYVAPHSLVEFSRVEATCTDTGVESHWICSACGKMFSDSNAENEIDAPIILTAKGHTLVFHAEVEATCESGLKAYWSCSICNSLFSDQAGTIKIDTPIIIPANPHTLIMHPEIPPTAETSGTETYWECSICGKLFSDADTLMEIDKPIKTTGGTCGTNVNWILNENGQLTIYGTGEITEHPWSTNKVSQVIIQTGITSICNDAFNNGASITDVSLPDGLKFIGDRAFNCCDNLTKISIPDSVIGVGNNSFDTTGIKIYAHLDEDGAKALSKKGYSFRTPKASYDLCYLFKEDEVNGLMITHADDNVSYLLIPEGVTVIAKKAFANHARLSSVSIPTSVVRIEPVAFNGCTKLTSIDIPNSVSYIGTNAFSNCSNIRKITIRGLLSSMPSLHDCNNLEILEIMTPLPERTENYPITNCNKLNTITILEGSTTIPMNNFSILGNCTSIRYVNTPKSLVTIESNAFMDTKLNTILVTKCDSYAHRWAKAYNHAYQVVDHQDPIIDEAVVPTCTTIGKTEGSHCGHCGEIIVAQKDLAKPSHTLIIHYQVNATHLHEGTRTYWECSVCKKLFSDSRARDVDEIDKPISIPIDPREGKWVSYCSVNEIDDLSWTSYSYNQSFIILNNHMIINNNSYDIGQYIEGDNSFVNNSFLSNSNSYNGHSYMSYYVYQSWNDEIMYYSTDQYTYNGIKHTSRTSTRFIREGLRYIFDPSTSIMYLPQEIIEISDEAFVGISAEEVCIAAGCESIGSMAFSDCPNLKVVIIPSSVEHIADDAFSGSSITIASYTDSYALNWASEHYISSINLDRVNFSQ